MNKSLIFNEIFDGNIMYCCNYLTYELDWVNIYTERKYGKVKKGQKCYEYFHCGNQPCKDCQNKFLAKNVSKYMNESFLWKKSVPVELEEYCVEDRIVAGDANKKISLIYSYDGLIKMAASSQIKQTYNVLLNKILKIDLEGGNETKLNHLIIAIQELFSSDRAVLVNKKEDDFNFVESRRKDIDPFCFDLELNKLVEDLVEKKTLGKKKKFLSFKTEQISKENEELGFRLNDKEINNAVFMKWKTDHQDFHLIVENIGVEYFDEELLLIIYNFCEFVLSLFFYNDMLYHLSNIDGLTELFNRNYYNSYLAELGKLKNQSVGIFFCDLDNLKEINDSYGHAIGDRILRKIATLLQNTFPDAKVCRIGGDEFVVIVTDTTKNKFNEMLISLCNKIEKENIKCSVGSAYKTRVGDIIQLIEEAENDMYEFKDKHHKSQIKEESIESFKSFVQEDIDNKRFTNLIQPVVDAKTNKIVSVEVLIRGIQKDGNLRLPNAFIPLFLKNQCIDLIDYYMIEQACIISKNLKRQNISLPITVNIGRKTIDKISFFSDVNRIFKEYNVEKDFVHFEVIESSDISLENIIEPALQLSQDGYVLELDGFATDFSSVSILTMNIFSKVKIGESILREARTNSFAKEILRTIINKSHEMSVVVCAKEIETKEQLEFALELGFDEIQGNIFHLPMEEQELCSLYLKQFSDSTK